MTTRQILSTLSTFIVALLLPCNTLSAQELNLSGRVTDSNNEPIPYATIVLLQESEQVAGCATNDNGEFSLSILRGSYLMKISFLGYSELEQRVDIEESLNLGNITLTESSTEIEEVVVKAQLIRREADRFVVDVSNSPIAVGRDATEILKVSPGVWVQDDKLTINGASGTKVYINDREVKMTDQELISYLSTIPADEIQRIDIIPQSGVEYDASSSGGIIKITTKRKLNTGLMGSASFRVSGRPDSYSLRPSLSLNYNSGGLNIYGRAWANVGEDLSKSLDNTTYTNKTTINSNSALRSNSLWSGANVGVVYDINERHSIGAEYSLFFAKSKSDNDTETDYNSIDNIYHSVGDYILKSNSRRGTATLNYIYKLDQMGSTFKFIADYTHSSAPSDNSYIDVIEFEDVALPKRDSTYRSSSESHYHLATATAAIEKILSQKVQLRAGLKYTFNKNTSISTYEWLNPNKQWFVNDDLSYNIGFTENIGAAYIAATVNFGRLSIVGGLRGEYTYFRSSDNLVKQDYFDLFPNANLSYALKKDGSYSIIAQYSRTIQRPSFWDLSPYESKNSEYLILRGNPDLKASYNNSLSITSVLKYKYSITLGMNIKENSMELMTFRDKNNPDLLIMQPINLPSVNSYFANVNIPVTFTKWWSSNFSLLGQYMGQKLTSDATTRHKFMGSCNATFSFILPKEFFIDLNGYYISGYTLGNTDTGDMGNINLTLKKRMLERKLTLTLGLNNLLPQDTKIYNEEETFSRYTKSETSFLKFNVSFSVAYNFNSGKKFKAKSVESGSAEDVMRLGGGGGE